MNMSMIMMTKDIPRSRDGLPMENSTLKIGPDHPALSAELVLNLVMDGDTVKEAHFSTTGKRKPRQSRPPTIAEHMEWLLRFANAVAYPRLHRNLEKLRFAARTGNTQQAVEMIRRIHAACRRNVLLRYRLRGLAKFRGTDAYDRLLQGLADVEKIMGSSGKVQFVPAQSVAACLADLELAQAVAAAASFHIDTGRVKAA
jgi:hypothetical protein